jgi:hypothetical protein
MFSNLTLLFNHENFTVLFVFFNPTLSLLGCS